MRMRDEAPGGELEETGDCNHQQLEKQEEEQEEPCASSRLSYGAVKQVDHQVTASEAVQVLSKVQEQHDTQEFTGLTEDQVTVTNYS